eukprot:m51a1_g5816 putative importin alpha (539) ;mRNA; f:211773-214510
MSTDARKSVRRAGISADDTRRRREEEQLQIRKQKRMESLTKRRHMPAPPADGMSPEPVPEPIDDQNLAALVGMINSADPKLQLEATTSFRKLLSIETNPPIEDVVRAGLVQRFVELLAVHANPRLQFEAAWSLTNISSGQSQHTKCVVDAGAVPAFVGLLSSPSEDVREQAAWALGNIAGDSAQMRDYVLGCGVMPPLVALLSSPVKVAVLRNATWSLSNLCRGKPQPQFQLVRPALSALATLIYHNDDEVLTDACWALSYLSDGAGERIFAVIESGVVRRVVELLLHSSVAVQTPALRTIGNIVTGDDVQTQVVINCGCLSALNVLLRSQKKGIKKEACWAISNITAGTKKQIQMVLDSGLLSPLLDLVSNSEFEIRKEAAWAVSNVCTGGSAEQVKFAVNAGAVQPLCDLLNVSDARTIGVALDALDAVLRVGEREASATGGANAYAAMVEEADGLTRIETLQTHQVDAIYERAVKILERYFNAEEDDAEAMALSSAAGAQQQGQQQNAPFQFTFGQPAAQGGSAAAVPPGGFSFA